MKCLATLFLVTVMMGAMLLSVGRESVSAQSIDTMPPQRPTLDLVDDYDTGRSSMDNVTNLTTLEVRISAEPSAGTNDYTVIKDGNTEIDKFGMPASGFIIRSLVLTEGPHPLSAESTDLAGNRSAQSEELLVTIDTVAPIPPSDPDLLPSSDSGTDNTDNNTYINQPAFEGFSEANAIVRIRANGFVVGQGVIGSDGTYGTYGVSGDGLGAWEVTIEPLVDGTYTVTAEAEDLAGNISGSSGALNPQLVIDTSELRAGYSKRVGGFIDLSKLSATDQPSISDSSDSLSYIAIGVSLAALLAIGGSLMALRRRKAH